MAPDRDNDDDTAGLDGFEDPRTATTGISRGRDGPSPFGFGPPPAQIPASGITALGSYLGYVAAKRTSG